MFLEILGIIFLVVICVVGFFAWKIYRFARAQANSDIATAISVLPSQEMELEPSNPGEWKEKERLEFTESELKRIGASHVGYHNSPIGCLTLDLSGTRIGVRFRTGIARRHQLGLQLGHHIAVFRMHQRYAAKLGKPLK